MTNYQAVQLFTREVFDHPLCDRRFSVMETAQRIAAAHGMTAQQLCRDYLTVQEENKRKQRRAAILQKIELSATLALILSAPALIGFLYSLKG